MVLAECLPIVNIAAIARRARIDKYSPGRLETLKLDLLLKVLLSPSSPGRLNANLMNNAPAYKSADIFVKI